MIYVPEVSSKGPNNFCELSFGFSNKFGLLSIAKSPKVCPLTGVAIKSLPVVLLFAFTCRLYVILPVLVPSTIKLENLLEIEFKMTSPFIVKLPVIVKLPPSDISILPTAETI